MSIVLPDGTLGKTCSICGLTKQVSDFHPHRFADGYANRCKACSTRKASITTRVNHTEQSGVLGKPCCLCHKWKPLPEFSKNARHWDGIDYRCKECAKARSRANWESDPIAWAARNNRSYHKHRKARREHSQEWYNAHLEEIRAKDRARYPTRYVANPYARASYSHARRARIRLAEGHFTPSEWKALCEHYDQTCLACGRRSPEIKLSPDHVIPIARGGSNGIENIQPLCLTCNLSKHMKIIDYRPP